MANYFLITGFWKDDRSEFNDYIVKDTHDADEHDDDVFFYGLCEHEIKQSLNDETTSLEFVITGYEQLNQ